MLLLVLCWLFDLFISEIFSLAANVRYEELTEGDEAGFGGFGTPSRGALNSMPPLTHPRFRFDDAASAWQQQRVGRYMAAIGAMQSGSSPSNRADDTDADGGAEGGLYAEQHVPGRRLSAVGRDEWKAAEGPADGGAARINYCFPFPKQW